MTSKQSQSALQEFALFEDVPPSVVTRYGLRPTLREFRASENLVVVGEPRAMVWFLHRGWARIRVYSPGGREATSGILGPGDVFGYANFFGGQTYQCTLTAMTDVSAVGVHAAAFEQWLRNDARAACRVIEILARQLLESTRLNAINAERASMRLQLTLAWLSKKFGPEIPATRSLLADLTGLRAETCSRVLSALRRRGVLRVAPRLVKVLRPDRLLPNPKRS
jgi:CRP/FNR family transcriptional regulator